MRRISIIAIVMSAFVTTTVAVLQFRHLFEVKTPPRKTVEVRKPSLEGGARLNDLGKMIHRSIVMDQKDLENVGGEILRIQSQIQRMQNEITNLKGVKGNISKRLQKLNVLRTVVEEKTDRKLPTQTEIEAVKDIKPVKPASNIGRVKKLLDNYKKVDFENKEKNVRIRVEGAQFFQTKSGTRVISKERFEPLRQALKEIAKEHPVAEVMLRPGRGSNIAEVLQFSNAVKDELGIDATLLPASRKSKEKIGLEIVASQSR